MIEGLFTTVTNVNFDDAAIMSQIKAVKEEKAKLTQGCSGCSSRCGRNDSYNMERLWNADEDIRSLKSLILSPGAEWRAYAYHALMLGYSDDEVNAFFYEGLFAVGEDWGMEELLPLF